MAGKPIWEGSCNSCGKHTTVPFVPLPGGSPPQCKQCHAQSKASRADQQQGRGKGRNKGRNRGGASSCNAARGSGGGSSGGMTGGTGSSKAAEQQSKGPADAMQPDQAQ
jgi:CxxC-x17-CxxC domain-containing protein